MAEHAVAFKRRERPERFFRVFQGFPRMRESVKTSRPRFRRTPVIVKEIVEQRPSGQLIEAGTQSERSCRHERIIRDGHRMVRDGRIVVGDVSDDVICRGGEYFPGQGREFGVFVGESFLFRCSFI